MEAVVGGGAELTKTFPGPRPEEPCSSNSITACFCLHHAGLRPPKAAGHFPEKRSPALCPEKFASSGVNKEALHLRAVRRVRVFLSGNDRSWGCIYPGCRDQLGRTELHRGSSVTCQRRVFSCLLSGGGPQRQLSPCSSLSGSFPQWALTFPTFHF